MVYYNMWEMMYGFGWGGMLFMIIFLISIIWFIIWIIKELINDKESATELLEKRYARGDIAKKQYLDMKKTLRR